MKTKCERNAGAIFVQSSTKFGRLSFSIDHRGSIRKWPSFNNDSKCKEGPLTGVIALNSQPILIKTQLSTAQLKKFKKGPMKVVDKMVDEVVRSILEELETNAFTEVVETTVRLEVTFFGTKIPDPATLVEACYPKDGRVVKVRRIERKTNIPKYPIARPLKDRSRRWKIEGMGGIWRWYKTAKLKRGGTSRLITEEIPSEGMVIARDRGMLGIFEEVK